MVSGSEDGRIRVWDIPMQACLWYCAGHHGAILAIDASHYPIFGSSASGEDYVARIWDVSRFNPMASDRALQKLEGHQGIILCLGFGFAGGVAVMATGSVDSSIRVWRCDDGNCVMVFRQGCQAVTCLAIMHKLLVTGSKDASIQVWDLHTLRQHCTLAGHSMAITHLDLSDGRLISSAEDGCTLVWDMAGSGSPLFAMTNKGVHCPEPDAPKNDPEMVLLQSVLGEHIVTKTLLGYPTLRTFNSSSSPLLLSLRECMLTSRTLSRKNHGPCGFLSTPMHTADDHHCSARNTAEWKDASPNTTCKTLCNSPLVNITPVSVLTFSTSPLLEKKGKELKLPPALDLIVPAVDLSVPCARHGLPTLSPLGHVGAQCRPIKTGHRSSGDQSSLKTTQKHDLTPERDQIVDFVHALRLSEQACSTQLLKPCLDPFPSKIRSTATTNRRSRDSARHCRSHQSDLESRTHTNSEDGTHTTSEDGLARIHSPSHTHTHRPITRHRPAIFEAHFADLRPVSNNQFQVAGDRDQTATGDPSYRAWKHKWMRRGGTGADPRVDGLERYTPLVSLKMQSFFFQVRL